MRNKIIIYDKNATPVNGGYAGHGFGLLKEASRCEITEELNGDYSLELDYPLDRSKAQYIQKWNVIRANGQLFRIYKISRCEITEELNGDYSLELDYPLDRSKAQYIQKWNVIRANGQLFRIYKIEDSTTENNRTAYARHISYDLANDFVLDDRVVKGTLKEMIEAAIPDYFKPHFTASSGDSRLLQTSLHRFK